MGSGIVACSVTHCTTLDTMIVLLITLAELFGREMGRNYPVNLMNVEALFFKVRFSLINSKP